MLHKGVGSTPDPSGYFLSSLPKASIPSLSSSLSSPLCPPLPVIYCLWLSPSFLYLVTRTQQSGLSTKGPRQRPSLGQDYCFPSGYCHSEGVVYLSPKAAAIWVMTQHWDPGSYSLSSVSKAATPSLSSGISSPLCPCLSLSPR